MACLRGPCPSAWLLNYSAFIVHREIIWPCPPLKAAVKKRLTHPFPEMFCKTEDTFYFIFLLPLPLYSAFWLEFLSPSLSVQFSRSVASDSLQPHESQHTRPPCPSETGIQAPTRWLFRDISLPSSWSASFLNKVIFLASTPCLLDLLACCAVSRLSLVSETVEVMMNMEGMWRRGS